MRMLRTVLHDSPIQNLSKKEKYLKSCARGTSREQILRVVRSHKSSIILECKNPACSAVRCFAVKVTGFRKQKYYSNVYGLLPIFFSLSINLSCWCCKSVRINNIFKAQFPLMLGRSHTLLFFAVIQIVAVRVFLKFNFKSHSELGTCLGSPVITSTCHTHSQRHLKFSAISQPFKINMPFINKS